MRTGIKQAGIAAVAAIAIFATLGEASSSGDSESSAPAASAAADKFSTTVDPIYDVTVPRTVRNMGRRTQSRTKTKPRTGVKS